MNPTEILNAVDDGTQRVLAAGMVDFDLSLVFMLGLFIVFAVLLHFIVLKPLIAAQEARHRGMGGAREDASSFELKAAEMRLDYDRHLAKARQDLVVVRDGMKKQASDEAHARVAATQAETDARIAAAKGELAKFAERARAEMKANADQIATDLAHKLLGGKA